MATIGTLTAVFDADTRKFDAGITHVNKQIGDTTTGLTGMSSKLGQVAGIAVIAAGAVGGLTASLWNSARGAASLADGLGDLSQRTGVSVGALSALKIAAESSGGSIETVNKSLGRYLQNISEANAGNEKVRDKFAQVGITAAELNQVYGDSDAAVSLLVKKVGSLGTEQDQLNALQKVGVRNGQELNGVINDMHGDFEAFRKEAEKLGLVITPEQAKEADKFDKSLRVLEMQVKAMTNTIAFQYLPQITGAIDDVSRALSANKGSWAAWGDFIRTEIRGVRIAAAGLASFISNIPSLGVGGAALIGIATGVSTSRRLHLEEGLSADISVGAGVLGARTGLGGTTGGGGGGGGGAKKLDAGVELLKRLEEQFRNLTPRTEAEKAAQELLGKEYDKTSDKIKRLIQVTAIQIDQQTKILAITRERYATQASLNRLEDEAIANQRALELTRERIIGDRPRRVGNNALGDVIDLGAGSFFSEGGAGGGRERIATAEQQVVRERLQMIHEQMMNLGQDLTNIFSQSIQVGIEQGGKRGLVSFAQGLLSIVEQVFLRKIAEGLGNILSSVASGTGGGFWSGLGRSLLGGLVSGAAGSAVGFFDLGGGSTFTPGGTGTTRPRLVGTRAGGGPVSVGMPYLVGERGPEMFIPGQSGQISPNGAAQTIIINVPVKSAGSYSSPKSRRELAQQIASAVQGAL